MTSRPSLEAGPVVAPQTQRVGWLPRGGLLRVPEWERRHRVLLVILFLHVPVIMVGSLAHHSFAHAAADSALVLIPGVFGLVRRLGRAGRSCAVSAGLIASSAALVHVSHGLIEMHFHFFVVVALLTLYQDWLPYLTAIALTVLGHGVASAIEPTAVYNHHQAIDNPWTWALIHGAFVLAASVANVAAWRVNEVEGQRLAAERDELYAERVQTLSAEVLRDPLTGLANRQLLHDRLTHALDVANRHGTRLAVVFVDLDGFKAINDGYGHVMGDEVLREIATRLRQRVRAQDTVARLGGDEFVIVCEDVQDDGAVDALVAELRALVARPVRVPGTRYQVMVTAAFGVAYSGDETDVAGLLDRADVRMYADKRDRIPRPRGATIRI